MLALLPLLMLLGACAPQPTGNSTAVAAELNYEGLETVSVRRWDVGQVRPGADFSVYSAVMLDTPRLAFRTPDRSKGQFPLSQEQKDAFRDLVGEVFESELATMTSPRFVSKPGPDVLELNVRLRDITATVPPRSISPAGRAAIALQAVGEITIVLELRDSESGEILARVVDQRAVEGVAIARDGGLVTRWDDVEQLCRRWASITRHGLESLLNR